MKAIAAISSPAQDDIIEKILRHIGLWNPPWNSERRARAPPNGGSNSFPQTRRPDLPEFSDRVPTDEDYCVDPPAPDDFT